MVKITIEDIRDAILQEVPADGVAVGNLRLREAIALRLKADIAESDYIEARDRLIHESILVAGRGRGGSVRRAGHLEDAPTLTLEMKEVSEADRAPKPRQGAMALTGKSRGKAAKAGKPAAGEEKIIAYQHDNRRTNNPEVGMVDPDTDPGQAKTTWAYDPHIDPSLQFDIGRARVESLIDRALAEGSDHALQARDELLAWIDHALAGQDEAAVREVVTNLRGRIAKESVVRPEATALEELKRQSAPYLNWTGKAERTSFEVDTVSLHVHERIDPATILAAVRKRLKQGVQGAPQQQDWLRAWFEQPLAYRDAIEFYKHDRGWANRLVAGDSLQVMNSLLQKEGMAGQVQMIYIDPPYGIKYGSNFQPFVNKRDVKDRKDEDLTQEPEMIKAFRDTWELGIHSYLTYLRDRLLLARELLHESGSVFVQISDENLHHVREVLEEIFGSSNFVCTIVVQTTTGGTGNHLATTGDYLVWFAKDWGKLKFRQPYLSKAGESGQAEFYDRMERPDGLRRAMTVDEKRGLTSLIEGSRAFRFDNLCSQSIGRDKGDGAACWFPVEVDGQSFLPNEKLRWKTNEHGMKRLLSVGRVGARSNSLSYVRYLNDFPVVAVSNFWDDLRWGFDATEKTYVVQTNVRVIERCMLMTTDPGDLVLDPTCGSGTTAFVAEKWGRRWITCDTSRVATTLAKQRLMTASFDYFELKYPHEGLKAGFVYKAVPHVTLKSIANNAEIDEIWERLHPAVEHGLAQLNATLRIGPSGGRSSAFKVTEGGRKGELLDFAKGGALQEWEVPFDFPHAWPDAARETFDAFHAARQAMQHRMDESIAAHADQETLFDQPAKSKDKLRITGPFTVEAVPFPTVLALDAASQPKEADLSIARSGESARQHQWRDELLKTGIRGKGKQMLKFATLEALPSAEGFRHLHCTGNLAENGDRVVVSFGPEYAGLEQRQVELALREAGDLFPRPKMVVFCAFAFDPEAAKDIDATKGIVALKAQMNTDLLTDDLKKNRASNQSFWLMGQPEIEVHALKDGQYQIEVHGFDYFDTKSGELRSGGKGKIAAWMLDTDYDERSLFPRQVFFPMAGSKDGWNKLKKNIKAELDEKLLDRLHDTRSLPFAAGENRKVAVKIIDDRGIESLKVIFLERVEH